MYLPKTHLEHAPPSGPLKPLLHLQSLAEPLPKGELDPEGQLEQVLDVVAPEAVEYFPDGHSMHSVAPDVSEYWPGSHAVQEYASAPEAPGTQAQLSGDVLPDWEVESGGHASQNADIEMKPATQR